MGRPSTSCPWLLVSVNVPARGPKKRYAAPANAGIERQEAGRQAGWMKPARCSIVARVLGWYLFRGEEEVCKMLPEKKELKCAPLQRMTRAEAPDVYCLRAISVLSCQLPVVCRAATGARTWAQIEVEPRPKQRLNK